MLTIAKRQETLNIASNIISGKVSVGIIENSLTIQSALKCSNIRSIFKKDEEIMLAFSVINVLVRRFLSSFGFSTKHSDEQIDTITADIFDNFTYESLEDIIIFLKMARTGKLGTSNRGIDSNLIIGTWMPKYLELKAEERENQHIRDKQERIKLELHPEAIQMHQKKYEFQQKEKAFRKYVEDMTKGINREQLEMLIEKCSKIEEVKPYLDILKAKRREIK